MRSYAVGDVVRLAKDQIAVVCQFRRGRLGSRISRLRLADGRFIYLKEAEGEAAEDLEAEFQRLEWLSGYLTVPTARWLESPEPGTFRMLLSCLPGRPAHQARLPEMRRIEILAQALLNIHAVPVAACPFRDTLDRELVGAEHRLSLGQIDLKEFLKSSDGIAPAKVLDELYRTRGIIRETVFTHGDYCLPNVMIQKGRLSGVIDWGLAGTADPHRDFMAISESIEFNLGSAWVTHFFDAYGGERPDPERVRYYTLLDQFFAHYRP